MGQLSCVSIGFQVELGQSVFFKQTFFDKKNLQKQINGKIFKENE